MARIVPCPNCGAPIEFKVGSSRALVCAHCRFTVVREGPDLKALGKLSDLVPTAAPMAVGDEGMALGRRFRVAGRVQLSQGAAPWDEFYVELEGGSWGWVASAQGYWIVTSPAPPPAVGHFQSLQPGMAIPFPSGPMRVIEVGRSQVVSAEGELPEPMLSGEVGAFADLEGPNMGFATIDFGDGRSPPQCYVGLRLQPDQFQVTSRAVGPRPEQRAAGGKLACLTCGAPIELKKPESAEAYACPYCSSLLDVTNGVLAVVHEAHEKARALPLPLGTEGTLFGETFTVIGFMTRSCVVDDETYFWGEYLLLGAKGYAWLVHDNDHFTFVRAVPSGDVGEWGQYKGKSYKIFSRVHATVEYVVGEFYWRVRAGDSAELTDFILPPYILGSERTPKELVWSAGEYVPTSEMKKAFGHVPGFQPRPRGVAPAQPRSFSMWPLSLITAVAVALMIALAVMTKSERFTVYDGPLTAQQPSLIPGLAPPVDTAVFSPRFQVADKTTLGVHLDAAGLQGWVGVDCALIDEATGEVREFGVSAEQYAGVTDGESWSEGSHTASGYLGSVQPGTYVLRLQGNFEPFGMSSPPPIRARVVLGDRSETCFLASLCCLFVPLGLFGLSAYSFNRRRWENSNL